MAFRSVHRLWGQAELGAEFLTKLVDQATGWRPPFITVRNIADVEALSDGTTSSHMTLGANLWWSAGPGEGECARVMASRRRHALVRGPVPFPGAQQGYNSTT